jgi:tRNA-2-methylthio-N6-dimethylallyladenosine synthase
MRRLTDVVERHALARHGARVGRTESVLLEGPSKNDDAMWSGRTRQNKLVHFSPEGGAPGEESLVIGGTADVVVTYAAPHWLRGDLVGIAPAPRPVRIRIPVSAAPA